jgi:hypothetical protein
MVGLRLLDRRCGDGAGRHTRSNNHIALCGARRIDFLACGMIWNGVRLFQGRRFSGWNCVRSIRVMPARSSVPSRRSHGGSNGGLLVTGSSAATVHRNLIVALAAQHRLPAVYFNRYFVNVGGLISYGPDYVDQFRRAAGYVDRILKGEKPGDLPVQALTKRELVINLKAAKELGLTIPPAVLARADAVLE